VDHLFDLLGQAMDRIVLPESDDVAALADAFAEMIRRFVRFAAAHPELNRIMVREATEASKRLTWVTTLHVRRLYEAGRGVWRQLLAAGIAAPVDSTGGNMLPVLLQAAT
jgi:hypothetical protein